MPNASSTCWRVTPAAAAPSAPPGATYPGASVSAVVGAVVASVVDSGALVAAVVAVGAAPASSGASSEHATSMVTAASASTALRSAIIRPPSTGSRSSRGPEKYRRVRKCCVCGPQPGMTMLPLPLENVERFDHATARPIRTLRHPAHSSSHPSSIVAVGSPPPRSSRGWARSTWRWADAHGLTDVRESELVGCPTVALTASQLGESGWVPNCSPWRRYGPDKYGSERLPRRAICRRTALAPGGTCCRRRRPCEVGRCRHLEHARSRTDGPLEEGGTDADRAGHSWRRGNATDERRAMRPRTRRCRSFRNGDAVTKTRCAGCELARERGPAGTPAPQ